MYVVKTWMKAKNVLGVFDYIVFFIATNVLYFFLVYSRNIAFLLIRVNTDTADRMENEKYSLFLWCVCRCMCVV